MIVQERKSKYKHKITLTRPDNKWSTPKVEPEMQEWCEKTFGPGGRKERWRFGWTDTDATFYFRQPKDAMLFSLRWS
jgi:hypothetical protein